MISLVKCLSCLLGKRGELRNKDVLLTPQLSSSVSMLEFLSSRVLLKMSLLLAMTINVVVFFLFLLFPLSTNSAVHFLPDAQSEEILSSPPIASIDSVLCEEIGYTYYSSGQCPAYHNQETCILMDKYLKCDATGWCRDNSYTISSCTSPKIVDTQCPNGLSLYKYCVCPSTYKYKCTGTGYSSGNGTVCESKYTKCNCSTNYVWSGTACVCDSAFKYTCSGTGYSSGSGVSCGGKYKSCNCSTYYSWNGSACAHVHSYVCPSGYSTSSSGMVTPVSASKVCQLSGCSSTSGTCYKETHTHSYSCPSGYSTSNAGMAAYVTASKSCSCGATSGTCYKSTHVHSYYCPSGSYTSASSCSAGTDGTVEKVCSCGATTTETCYKCKHVHSYYCPSGSYSSSSSCLDGTSGTVSKVCSCGATSGTCYKCAAHYCSYSCPSGSYTSSSSCSYGVAGNVNKKCRCGATNSETCYKCNPPPHTHYYSCGYSTSKSGMVEPEKVPLQCSCGDTQDGECYKDNHSHDYSPSFCPTGYSSSKYNCRYGYYTEYRTCSCGYKDECYKCKTGGGYKCPPEICVLVCTTKTTGKVCATVLEDGTCSESCYRYSWSECCGDDFCTSHGGTLYKMSYGDFCTWQPGIECVCGEEL